VTIGGVALMTARMRIVPREMLGRMTGGFSTVIVAAGTVGTLLGGALAKIDLRTPYLTCAGAFLVLFVVVYPRLAVLNGSPAEAAAVTIPAPAAPAEVDAAAGSGSASGSDPGWDPGSDPGSDPDLESGPESDPAVTRRKTREPVDRP
jgi:MFS family permease